MLKMHRNYKIEFTIERPDENGGWKVETVLTVQNPISCNFSTQIAISGQSNTANIQLINLNESTRKLLQVDFWESQRKRVFFTFSAGYGYPDSPSGRFTQPVIYKGRIMSCTSSKLSGSVDWTTDIQAAPSSIFESVYINATISGGTSLEDVLNYMIQRSSNLKLGYVTPDLGVLPRNKTYIGKTVDLLHREYGGYEIFVANGEFNILGDNDVIPGDLLVITDASGLLGTPKQGWAYLELDILFEPQLKVGQAVSLDSKLMPQYNQTYKVMAIQHSGTISERESGNLITRLTLSSITDASQVRELEPAKPTTYKKEADTSWIKPVKGKLTSPFGWRTDPVTKQRKYHEGIDIGTERGIPIYAPANGTVTTVGWIGGYGRAVVLDNGKNNGLNLTSLFGHMERTNVRYQEQVYKGKTILGYVGSTGKSTGPHLHLEIRENGKPINPSKYVGSY